MRPHRLVHACGKLSLMTPEAERWHIGERFYVVTFASTPDSLDLELYDVGPAVGRGTIAIASRPDGGEAINVRLFSDGPLPIEVVEQFVAEARVRL